MRAQSEFDASLFKTSRRRSHGLLAGILLVFGYFCTAAVLIRDYTVSSPSIEHMA